MKIEKMNLKDFAIGNIEAQLNDAFIERKMTKKLREQIAGDMAVIASNAFRVGYYAHAKEIGMELTTDDFKLNGIISELLPEVIWRVQEAGK
jgi:predicted nucleic acid-binding protein